MERPAAVKKILLLPFCLAKDAQAEVCALASRAGYAVVVAQSTARALAAVRRHAVPGSGETVRVVGVVCDGRAKKVWIGLAVLRLRQWGKRLLGRKTRRIELARVPIVGGTKSLFGRRKCRVGFNVADDEALRRALGGLDTFMRM